MAEDAVAEPRRRSVQCASPKGLHRMAYLEWGDPRNRDVLVCVHGLTRIGARLRRRWRARCGHYRVVCPDVAGRGESDRLADPMLYVVPQYAADMVTLIARLDVETGRLGRHLDGRLIGMALAAQAGTPVRKPGAERRRPGGHARRRSSASAATSALAPVFPTFEAAEKYVRAVSRAVRPAQRRAVALPRRDLAAQGRRRRWRPHYDPRIAEPFRATMPDGRPRALARLRRDPLPDAGAARRAVRPALAANTATEMARARTEGEGRRDRRRRPCADPAARRPDRSWCGTSSWKETA